MTACLLADVLACPHAATGAPHGLCGAHWQMIPPNVQASRHTPAKVAAWFYADALAGLSAASLPEIREKVDRLAQTWGPLLARAAPAPART